MDTLVEHETGLTARLLQKLARLENEGVRVYGITDPSRAAAKVGVVPFEVEGWTGSSRCWRKSCGASTTGAMCSTRPAARYGRWDTRRRRRHTLRCKSSYVRPA
jgi:selenocysteine lyase/cysteine desulfurase